MPTKSTNIALVDALIDSEYGSNDLPPLTASFFVGVGTEHSTLSAGSKAMSNVVNADRGAELVFCHGIGVTSDQTNDPFGHRQDRSHE